MGGVCDHAGKAAAAARTALSTSALVERWTLARTSPVAGLVTACVRAAALCAVRWPAMKFPMN